MLGLSEEQQTAVYELLIHQATAHMKSQNYSGCMKLKIALAQNTSLIYYVLVQKQILPKYKLNYNKYKYFFGVW